MVFFKRLSRSRSRSNSQTYIDNHDPRHDSKTQYDDQYAVDRSRSIDHFDDPVPTSAHSERGPRLGDPTAKGAAAATGGGGGPDMYARRDRPTEVGHQYGNANSYQSAPMSGANRGMSDGYASNPALKSEPAPNLLVEAFNQAIRPYSDKIENLESEIADLRAYIQSLERQQTEVHGWIDKRGLRPGTSQT
jgi:hypothetical protein